jgi:hypothetical protein
VRGGSDIDAFIASVQTDLASGTESLTIGMECPLFLPVPASSQALSTGRIGESDRSCFASAGAYVATLGVHQFAYILKSTRRDGVQPTVDWRGWAPQPSVVLFWEAFVSKRAHSAKDADTHGHARDAATAAVAFEETLALARAAGNMVQVPSGTSPLSLAGLALLWSGWSSDLSLLSRDLLVVKPDKPFAGDIQVATSATR